MARLAHSLTRISVDIDGPPFLQNDGAVIPPGDIGSGYRVRAQGRFPTQLMTVIGFLKCVAFR